KGEEVTAARPVFRARAPGPEKVARKREKEAPPQPGKTVVARQNPLYGDERTKVTARKWEYSNEDSGRKNDPGFSMVCAGGSSLLLAHRNLAPAYRDGPKGEKLRAAIRDGYGWLCRYFSESRWPGNNAYAFYSLEKAGDIGEVVSFGGVDWYEKMAS